MNENTPLGLATAEFEKEVRSGEDATCPCCGRNGSYWKSLQKGHVRELYRLFITCLIKAENSSLRGKVRDQVVHTPTELVKGATSYSQDQIAHCAKFELVEAQGGGHYKISLRGLKFCGGTTPSPKEALVWQGEVLKYRGLVEIGDLLTAQERTVIEAEQRALAEVG